MPPNIVLVVADDLGVGDLECYRPGLIRTPAVTRLARGGMVCESMYAAASEDTPSRAGMLTGRFGARYRLPGSAGPGSAGLPERATTMATLLRGAGYATGLFGQWRLGASPGPMAHGFDRFSGTLYGTDVTPLTWYEDGQEDEQGVDPALAAGRLTDSAIRFMDGVGDQPFFACLSHLAPHAPFRPEPRFDGQSEAGWYGDVVEQIDYYLELLVRRLHRTQRATDTLIIFTSDNGPRYEGHNQSRRGRKPEVMDGGVRVPFVASWLGTTRRVRDRVPRSLLDLTPSLLRLAEAPVPQGLDGRDSSALLSGGRPSGRDPVYLFYGEYLNAVRDGQWKLHVAFRNNVRNYMPQLFDIDADFRENYNVAELFPEVVDRLRGPLEALKSEVDAEAASGQQRVAA